MFEVRIPQVQVVKVLGEGATSQVIEAQTADGQRYAVKVLRDIEYSPCLDAEARILSNLDHPNIIKYYGLTNCSISNQGEGCLSSKAMVLELAENGCLFDYANQLRFSEPLARYFAKQLLDGLEFCHLQSIAHRDLKLDNLLLGANYELKIADFGFACPVVCPNGSLVHRSLAGTPQYMAPERFKKKGYNAKEGDIFSVGVILFMLVMGWPPFKAAKRGDKLYSAIALDRADIFWARHSKRSNSPSLSLDLMLFIQSLL